MKVLFIGDVVGVSGRDMVAQYVPLLKKKYKPQVTIVNGENSSNAGKGITEKIYKDFLKAGVDILTMGNHTFDNREIFDFIDDAQKMLRPANFPAQTTPGKGMAFIKVNQQELAVLNLQGRAFMNDLDDPFRKAEELLDIASQRTPFIFVDFHAETTSEKQAMGWYLDGRVSAIVGTHTHVQTNDARILPQGTAYLTDAGMTGPFDGVLGMKKEQAINRFLTQLPTRLEVAEEGRTQLCGCLIELSDQDGKARSIKPFQINEDHPFEF